MNEPYLDMKDAAALGRYTVKALRREMERGRYVRGVHYFNRGGIAKGKILFYRDKFVAVVAGLGNEPDALEFSKEVNRRAANEKPLQ